MFLSELLYHVTEVLIIIDIAYWILIGRLIPWTGACHWSGVCLYFMFLL